MKTRQYTIAILIALIFGTFTIQAQSNRRSTPQDKKEKTPATRSYTKKSTPQKARTTQPARQAQKQQVQRQRTTQPARQAQKQQVQRQRTTQPARQVQKQQVQRQRTTQPARQVQKQKVQRQRTTHQSRKPVSISTPNNPRNSYRKANSKVHVSHNRTGHSRVNKYSRERYYGGRHYHNAYPTRKVKIHYHHDTYVHNYHVLYYPTYGNIYWSRSMYRDYRRWYPEYHWRYNYGYRIQSISVFDAKYNLGEVAMVYGRVYATWHNRETDDFLLFFGGDYPYQQFTVVLPGNVARRFSWRPERYFLGEHLTVTGLITTFDGSPEIIVKNKRQVGIY
ncbi:MAG: hypothetical protein ABFS38_01660 [Bacteroidota bacterium]